MEVLKNSLNGSKIERVLVANSEKQCRVYQNSTGVSKETPLIKITGVLTSPLQPRGEQSETKSAKQGTKEPYHYAFIKLKGQTIDLPVIFKIKDKLNLKRGELVELLGNYSNSTKSIRKSFTVYQISNEKKVRKKCIGCLDDFVYFTQENYDYCPNCSLNGSRYVRQNCPECGDGSSLIKFPHQPLRNCKTCYLTKQEKTK